ncbi:MAG: alpha/beta hydrolase [Chloroflexaceae bacterium]|nr:alpha/beta hydrolase [Chloroflexaceae bacterium]
MIGLPHMTGIRARHIDIPAGAFYLLEAGQPDRPAIVFVHGNVSSAAFWEETMLAMAEQGFWALAPDLRGYGGSPSLPIEARYGLQPLTDDLHAIMTVLNLQRFHLIGHSMGGMVAMHYAIDHADYLQSLTLLSSGSPYGFGGTKDVDGTPCWPDYAGSGGGLVNQELLNRIMAGDLTAESPFSPRNLLKNYLTVPPFTHAREDTLIGWMLRVATELGNYSRDMTLSANWPWFAPGTHGINNALSPKYCNLRGMADITPQPPVFWIRGEKDHVVSDQSLADPGTLGAMGVIPNWPGAQVFPSQPMVGQVRAMLERYRSNGGSYTEHMMTNIGHMPHLEDLPGFLQLWLPFLQQCP